MTSLQKQLAAIAATSTHQLDLKAQRTAHGKSLLFEPKVAASQSFDTIYAICYDGYRNLCAIDPRFLAFSRTIFSEQSKDEDRAQKNKAENDDLNKILESFITLVGPRLLLKPAEKALEWLVRRFRVHENNTESLVLTYLPYHGTPQFLSLLSILPSSPPPALRFLHPYLSPPTNPPRSTIVYTAVNNPNFFTALQAYVVSAFKARHQGPGLVSFWASVTTQAIDGILEGSQSGRRNIQDQKMEQLLLRVFPALNACLQLSESPEAIMGCYMVIIVLVTKAQFEDKILDPLLEAVIRSAGTEVLESCLTCMSVIAEERMQMTLSAPVTKRLLKINNLVQVLQGLSAKCRVERLALGVALGALDNISRSIRSQENRDVVHEILISTTLAEPHRILVLTTLFHLIEQCSPGSSQHGELVDLANRLVESSSTMTSLLHQTAKNSGLDLVALGIISQNSEQSAGEQDVDSDDEMLDLDDGQATGSSKVALSLAPIFDTTLLSTGPTSFPTVLAAFEQAVRNNQIQHFFALKELKRDKAALVHSVKLVQEIICGNIAKDRGDVQDAAFDWLDSSWPAIKKGSRLTLSHALLDVALSGSGATTESGIRRTRSIETLRSVKLDTNTLLDFVRNVPLALDIPDGPPAKKRRRTSRNELTRAEIGSSEDLSRLLGRLTLTLEIVESSSPASHPELLPDLFRILGELQQLKQYSGSELVYLQSLVLGSLTPIVGTVRDLPNATDYQQSVRVDLLIDCIRHSTSRQVQNAALLLIAGLASWLPELVLHNLMPIFTFIGSTLLKQGDDYSAHVVDQTISQVVPRLAESLRMKDKNLLSGVSDLLLSFTAAFEHIPLHRRQKLFSELARTLGPADSLSAIMALLVDRYSTSPEPRKFIPGLLLGFEPMSTLHALKGYLDLVADGASPKRKISNSFFSLNEKSPAQIDNTLNNLLDSLVGLITNQAVRKHINKAFRKAEDRSKPQELFAAIVGSIIQLSGKFASNPRLDESCRRLLTSTLELLPTPDLIRSSEYLIPNPEPKVQIAVIRAVELRAGSVSQNDHSAVASLLSFIPRATDLLQESLNVEVQKFILFCIDCIIERFGKKDLTAVSEVANIITGHKVLASTDDRLRISSLLCITSIVDVLEEDAISLLPKVLPVTFDYLRESIVQRKFGLHDAAFSLLTNIAKRLSFMFSREYLNPALELVQRSAVGNLEENCNNVRHQFSTCVSTHIEPQEIFSAIKSTWPSAIRSGYQASHDMLRLIEATIDNQPKSKMIKSSPTLFDLVLEAFGLREFLSTEQVDMDDDEIDLLETALINSVISMTLKLNDTVFRPFFAQLVDQVSSSSKKQIINSITFCKFLAAFFDRFKSIVTGYSSYVIEHIVWLLEALLKSDDVAGLQEAVLTALQKSFQHDQDGFWQSPSHYTTILQPLLSQLASPTSSLDRTGYAISAITGLANASASSIENHREMNAVLLKYMRAEEAHTRLATVKCEQSLTKKLGEEWLGLLPEMLPFISELREDDDEIVERETQRWITMMEGILGEDLEPMLQ